MGEKWPKTGHIPPHFLFEADIWLPGIYFHLCLDHRPEITVLGHTAFCRITRDFLADGIMPARVGVPAPGCCAGRPYGARPGCSTAAFHK